MNQVLTRATKIYILFWLRKKYIELNDKEHTLAVECLVLTNAYYIRKKQMGMSDEIDNVIHKIHG